MEYFAIAASLAFVIIICAHLFSKKEKPEIVRTGYVGSSWKGSMSAAMSREDYENLVRSQKRSMADSQKRDSPDDDSFLAGAALISNGIDWSSGSDNSSSDCGSSDSGGGGDSCGGSD